MWAFLWDTMYTAFRHASRFTRNCIIFSPTCSITSYRNSHAYDDQCNNNNNNNLSIIYLLTDWRKIRQENDEIVIYITINRPHERCKSTPSDVEWSRNKHCHITATALDYFNYTVTTYPPASNAWAPVFIRGAAPWFSLRGMCSPVAVSTSAVYLRSSTHGHLLERRMGTTMDHVVLYRGVARIWCEESGVQAAECAENETRRWGAKWASD